MGEQELIAFAHEYARPEVWARRLMNAGASQSLIPISGYSYAALVFTGGTCRSDESVGYGLLTIVEAPVGSGMVGASKTCLRRFTIR